MTVLNLKTALITSLGYVPQTKQSTYVTNYALVQRHNLVLCDNNWFIEQSSGQCLSKSPYGTLFKVTLYNAFDL